MLQADIGVPLVSLFCGIMAMDLAAWRDSRAEGCVYEMPQNSHGG